MSVGRISIIEPVGGHGGMDFYDYGLANGIATNGLEVTLYTCNETQTREYPNVITSKTFGDVWKKNKLAKLRAFLGGYMRSFQDSKKNNAAVAHFHFFQISWLNLIVLRMAKRYSFKKVLTLHDVDPLVNKASSRLHRLTYKLVDHVIVHNEFSRKELSKKDVSSGKITVIPHGNYLPFIERIDKSESHSEKLSLLFFGQIKEMKGLDVLLEALAIAIQTKPTIHLTIAGRPWHTESEKYTELIKFHGLEQHVKTVFEYIPNEDVADYFAKCDLVVLPYKRIYQSGVLLLSMSYEKSCLTSDLEPFSEIIEHGKNGFLFQSESAQDLSRVLLEIERDKNKLKEVSSKASELLKDKFDWKIIGERTKALYSHLLNQNN